MMGLALIGRFGSGPDPVLRSTAPRPGGMLQEGQMLKNPSPPFLLRFPGFAWSGEETVAVDNGSATIKVIECRGRFSILAYFISVVPEMIRLLSTT